MNAHAPLDQPGSAPATSPVKYRLCVADYLLLHEQGSFHGQETELVDGEVYLMSPEWRPHLRVKSELAYLLRRAVEHARLPYFVGIEGSIALSETDMPRPDVLLTSDIYGDGAVPHETVPLVVEVSSTTLNEDLGRKAQRYAAAAIREYWVVDVTARVIHQMWDPSGAAYAGHREVPFGQQIQSTTFDGLVIATVAI